MTRLLLARHGQTDDNLAGDVFQGFRDTPLNDTGRRQAEVLAAQAEADFPVDAVWSSDLKRARETAEIVGAALDLEPKLDPRLREGNRGAWEGRRFAEVERAEPELYRTLRSTPEQMRFPGGESLAEQQQRVLAALSDIRAAGGQCALVVCHLGSIRVALCSRDPRGLSGFFAHEVENTGVVEF
ncbi:MAG: histidine phosphatase family protein [Solirubrobacterales bacterium]|nr:histidine phosphatase family protein [Solirubrobacterales bacterium]